MIIIFFVLLGVVAMLAAIWVLITVGVGILSQEDDEGREYEE